MKMLPFKYRNDFLAVRRFPCVTLFNDVAIFNYLQNESPTHFSKAFFDKVILIIL